MEHFTNTSYFFIPFSCGEPDNYRELINALECSNDWIKVNENIKYMLKYVADKIHETGNKPSRCCHFILNNNSRKISQYIGQFKCYYNDNEIKKEFKFNILEIHLYYFSTSVGIIAFKVHFNDNDPFVIANAQYYLKKVSRQNIYKNGSDESITFLDISKKIVEDLHFSQDFDFFFYSFPSNERANVLSYLEVEPKDDYRKELYYLRRCYSNGFSYIRNPSQEKNEIFSLTKNITWGISSEAAVCLSCPQHNNPEFSKNTFYSNFTSQYLFMYILLLHQKYVLYLFLTQIGIGENNDLNKLEKYKSNLYEFETDFVFSCVTEVPQYQILYEKLSASFELEKMYTDVHEPLISLAEIRKKADEEEGKRRDDKLNFALILFSVLTLFSALTDSVSFAENIQNLSTCNKTMQILQIVFFAFIGLVSLTTFLLIIKSKKK